MSETLSKSFMVDLARTKEDPSAFSELVFGTPLHSGQRRYADNATAQVNFLLPGNSFGKVISDDTPVLTPKGWVPHGDLRPGDEVYSVDGQPTLVTATFPNQTQEFYRLTFDDGSTVDAGVDHLWTVQGPRQRFVKNYNEDGKEYPNDQYGSWVTMTTGDIISRWGLKPKPKNRVALPAVEPVEFPERRIPVDPYTLGAILGDGSVSKTGHVRLTSADPELVDALALPTTHRGGYDYGVLGAATAMRQLGLDGHRAWEKFVPEDYLWNVSHVRLGVLQGLMDTDGTVSPTGAVEFCTTSEQLAHDVVFLVQSLGGKASWRKQRRTSYTHKGEKKQGRLSYRIGIRHLPMNPFRLSRKADLWRPHSRTGNKLLVSAEPLGVMTGQCIKVAHESQLYVLKDFIVTHNTEFIIRFACYLAWFKLSDYPPETFKEWLQQGWKGLVASYTYPIAKESFERAEQFHRSRPEFRALVKSINKADGRITFNNGAVLDWGSLDGQGKLVEAARRQVILVDEAGHIPDLSATFDNILFPRTMGVGGRIHLLGTPKAHSDPYLLEVYEKGRDGKDPFYYSQAGSVFENEFWPAAEKERVLTNPRYVTGWEPCPEGGCDELDCVEREGLDGPQHPLLTAVGRQVIKGHFVISGGYFFNRHHVRRIFTGEHPDVVWHGENHFHTAPKPGHLYQGAFDLGGNRLRRKGTRTGSDATVGFVIDYTERPWTIVHFEYIEGGSADWQQKYDLMTEVFNTYQMPYLLIDATGQVDSVVEALQDRGVEVEGVQFGGTGSKKFDMLRALQLATELEWDGSAGVLRSPMIPQLKRELDHYVLPDDKITQDCVMALAMAVDHVAQWELPEATGGEVY